MSLTCNHNQIGGYSFQDGITRIFKNRKLLFLFIERNIKTKYQGSFLGPIWMTLNPLLLLFLYTFVFGFIFNGTYRTTTNESGIEYALGIFFSITFFQLFAESMSNSAQAISNNPNLVKKVIFPLEILPASIIGAQLFQYLISLILVIIGLITLGNGIFWSWLFLPVLILPMLLISLGTGYLLSLLGAYMRDTVHITMFLSTLLLFGSAVFFSTSALPDLPRFLLSLNPLTHAIEQGRNIMIWGESPKLWPIIYLNLFSVFAFITGFTIFQKARAYIADVL